jgi:hypothetical protein
MQSILDLTRTNKLTLAAFAFLAVLTFGGGRADAATLNVSGGCTLAIAIDSVNAGADQSGCTATGAAYGTDDTITLPAGNINLSADLPTIVDKSLKVIGAGKGTTTIDADGNTGFFADPDPGPSGSRDHLFKDFSITGADTAGIAVIFSGTVTLDSVEVTDSTMGAYLGAIHIIVKDSNISNNTNTTVPDLIDGDFGSSLAGLGLLPQPASPSDIPSVDITDSIINGNSSESAGLNAHLFYDTNTGDVDHLVFNIARTTIADNTAEKWAGAIVYEEGGTVASVGTELSIDAVTVSGNSVEVATANPLVDPLQSQPYVSGMIFGGKFQGSQNITNLTAANNSVVNELDDQVTIAGFLASLSGQSDNISLTNATVVNNAVTQTQTGAIQQQAMLGGTGLAFFVDKIDFSGPALVNGASAKNSLIAGNTTNGNIGSCIRIDSAVLGLSGEVDLTPVNLGNNITDDPNCTGYTVSSNILSTLGSLQNNGGPVETIALLDGSPAIKAGGTVLGLSTDARGISRPTDCPSVGAYQFEGVVCGASTNNPSISPSASAPATGVKSENVLVYLSVVLVGTIIAGFSLSEIKRSVI